MLNVQEHVCYFTRQFDHCDLASILAYHRATGVLQPRIVEQGIVQPYDFILYLIPFEISEKKMFPLGNSRVGQLI